MYVIVYYVCLIDFFYFCHVFFFKQKTAYEMRISDWSSDVCSSDLLAFGRFNAGLALFQIDKPNSFVDPVTIVYGNYGTQRNRGVEITLDGEPVDGLRIISGLTFNDARLRRTEGGVNEGNDAVGVPEMLAKANIEWDLPFELGRAHV